MSDGVNLQFILARLDSIQKELGMMRLRDEQREAGYQAIAATLSRQMVEVTATLETRLDIIDNRMIALETRLDRLDDQLDTIVNQLADIGRQVSELASATALDALGGSKQ